MPEPRDLKLTHEQLEKARDAYFDNTDTAFTDFRAAAQFLQAPLADVTDEEREQADRDFHAAVRLDEYKLRSDYVLAQFVARRNAIATAQPDPRREVAKTALRSARGFLGTDLCLDEAVTKLLTALDTLEAK